MTQKDYQSFFQADFCGVAQLVQKVLLPALTLNQESYANKETQPLAQQELGNANIQSAILSGTININGAQIDVWDVTVKPNCRLHIARQAIRNCFRSYTEHYSGAFIIFHYENCANQPWRLSWLSLGQNNQDVNNAKRYTYLCGKNYACRTIAERFVVLETTTAKTLDSITKAFDVEALSDEFFSEYRVLYNDIVQYITGQRYIKKNNKWECYPEKVTQDAPGYSIYLQFARLYDNNEEQAVKAVRDYVKKLMGRLVFIQFVQKKNWLKINSQPTTNFLLDIFDKVKEYQDDFIESVLEKVVYMLLNQEHTGYEKIGDVEIDVPFLNGGLFEPDTYDAGTNVKLPKEFFHNPEYAAVKRTLSDNRLRAEDEFFRQCGILDLFYQYNFTIDENDPNDAEIGVDPEMLGKIFENLLEDNKDKGAFYTPKEIVNYMCEESLIAYLNTKVPGIENAIRQWVADNDNSDAIITHREALQNALREVKICDPAVGSGAFPMGLLNLLLRLRGTTHMTEAERCQIKKEIIQNNIYGVDIEKGAVDIARLRFWLSIVVDLDNPTALPNMDFKIMQGNSLLEWYEGVDLSGMSLNEQAKKKTKKGQAYEQTLVFDEQDSLDNIQNAIREYYGTDDHQEKVKLRGIINSNVKSYIRNLKGCTPEIQQKLETLPIPNDKFFLWHIYFKEVCDNGGFDIIIGNPPYGANIDDMIDVYGELYPKTSHGYKDIYKYFYDCFINKLTFNGVLCYITPSTFLRQPKYGDLRRVLLEKQIIQVLDLGENIFEEAVVPVAVTLIKNCDKQGVVSFVDLTKIITNENASEVLSTISFTNIEQTDWNTTVNNIFIENIVKLDCETVSLEKIIKFKDAGINYQRVNVGLAQKGKSDLSSRLMYEGERESSSHIEFWKGTDINEYYIAPVTRRYCRPKIQLASNERVILNSDYFAVAPKLIWRQTAPYPISTIDYEGVWFGRSIQAGIIDSKYISKVSYEYLCGLLNSKYLRYLYEQNVKEGGRVYPQVKLEKLRPLPIVIPSAEQKADIENLVTRTISATSSGDFDTAQVLKDAIDKKVFELYNVDPSSIL